MATTRNTRRRKTSKRVSQPVQTLPVRLPEGYHGPAYQLDDGRTLFVGRRFEGLQHHWSTLYLDAAINVRVMYRAEGLPVVSTKQQAVADLICFASQRGLRRVQ